MRFSGEHGRGRKVFFRPAFSVICGVLCCGLVLAGCAESKNGGQGGSTGSGAGTSGSSSGGTTGTASSGGDTTSSSGGTSSAGGSGGDTGVDTKPSGLPAPGAGGVAKPTGAGSNVVVLPWAGFTGAVSFNFDDANQTQIDHYKEMQALNDKGNNVRFTFYLQTNKSRELGDPVWPQALKDGHELGNHTQTHPQTANASDMQAAEDFIQQKFGVTAYSFAAPYGDASYGPAAMGKFLTNRGVSGGSIGMTDDPATRQFILPCTVPGAKASAAAMQSPVDSATKAGNWTTLLIHGFTGGSDGAYNAVDFSEWAAMVKAVRDQGTVWVDTVGRVSAYWIAAYYFSKLTPTTSGSDKVWTWKVSDFNNRFPPGQYLRVTTDGGTLKQGNTILEWDEHGYYEVSLDAGTLTLSP